MYWKIKYTIDKKEQQTIIEAENYTKKRIKQILQETHPGWEKVIVKKLKQLPKLKNGE